MWIVRKRRSLNRFVRARNWRERGATALRRCLVAMLLLATPLTAAAAILIDNVTVLPMTGVEPLRDHAVLIEGDRIVAVQPRGTVNVPDDSTHIDGMGGFLIPGLGDMHVHLVNPSREPYSADMLALYLTKGVTTVRSMWGGPGHMALRDRILAENLPAPTLILAGPGFGSDRMSVDEAALEVERQANEGWDLVKMHWKPSADVYDIVMETAAAHGIEVSGHIPYAIKLPHALARGQRTIEHLDGYLRELDDHPESISIEPVVELARGTREAGTAVVPTLFSWEIYLGYHELDVLNELPELAYVPQEQRERWNKVRAGTWAAWIKNSLRYLSGSTDLDRVIDRRRQLLRVMNDENVEILFGTDSTQPFAVPGFAVAHEMRALIEAGLTHYQALESASAAVGRYLERTDGFGIIAPGARADLVLLETNPLESIDALDHPKGVLVRGRWYDRTWIEQTLETIAGRYR